VVIDPEDRLGYLFAAFDGDQIVGCIRCNLLRDGLVEPHARLLRFDRLGPDEIARSSVSSRLLVASDHRGTPTAVRLAQACFRAGLAKGVAQDFILVKPELATLYQRLGYRPLGPNLDHPEVGPVCPLRLDLTDFAHLQAARSLLAVDGRPGVAND
jgi:hypothetical protein